MAAKGIKRYITFFFLLFILLNLSANAMYCAADILRIPRDLNDSTVLERQF